MDSKTFRRHTKISKNHTKHCYVCGHPSREGCTYQCCNEVMHCACAMIK